MTMQKIFDGLLMGAGFGVGASLVVVAVFFFS
jgi:hypothetical protein